jgi:hypothetical protein
VLCSGSALCHQTCTGAADTPARHARTRTPVQLDESRCRLPLSHQPQKPHNLKRKPSRTCHPAHTHLCSSAPSSSATSFCSDQGRKGSSVLPNCTMNPALALIACPVPPQQLEGRQAGSRQDT